MAFLNLEKVGRDFTLSGKEFHNFIVEGKKDLELLMFYRFVNLIKILMFYHFVNLIKILMFNHFVNLIKILMFYHFVNLIKILMFYHFVNFLFAIILTSVNFQVSTNYKKNLLKFD